jgi:hypothetical protein
MAHDRRKNGRISQPPRGKLLRESGGVELWQLQKGETRRYEWSVIKYEVGAFERRTFDRRHEAWTYFERLTTPSNDRREPSPGKGRGSSS